MERDWDIWQPIAFGQTSIEAVFKEDCERGIPYELMVYSNYAVKKRFELVPPMTL